MEIYSFDSGINNIMKLIYLIGAIVFAVALFYIIELMISQIKAYKKSKEKFPKRLAAFFIVIIIIPLVGFLGLGNLFLKNAVYDINMRSGNAYYITGNVEILSCQEERYRDENVTWYIVKLQINDEIITPCNAFPKEVIEHFESDEILTVQYGNVYGDGFYIWKINSVTE